MAVNRSGNWWETCGQLFNSDSSLNSTQLGAGVVTSTKLDTDLKKWIPGTATIHLSTHSSDDQYQATVALFDVGGNAWARRQRVRLYIQGDTGDAGGAVASTVYDGFAVKSTATTDVYDWASTINTGIIGTTNTAGVDYDFLTASDGTLTVRITKTTETASSNVLVVDWFGGCVRSSDNLGTTLAAT